MSALLQKIRAALRPETLVIGLVLGSAVGIGGFVHNTMTQVREALPAQVLGQQADIAQVLHDLANLMRALEVARLDPAEANLATASARLDTAARRVRQLRTDYSFDSLIGASGVHAVVYPAAQDMRRWLDSGLYHYPPAHPAVLSLVNRRAEEAHRQVGALFLKTNAASTRLLENEAGRIESFRVSMISYLIVFALLACGVIVLFLLQRNAQNRLDVERRRLVDSIETMNEGFALFDSADQLLLCNRRFRELHDTGTLDGRPDGGLRRAGQPFEIVREEDGRCLRVSERRTREGGMVGIYTDVTDLRRAESRLRHLSVHDPLTGLLNRAAFTEPALASLAQRRRDGGQMALLLCNLDQFKLLNDTFGDDTGDEALRRVAVSLKRCLRESDFVARIGGDEFVVLLSEVSGWREAAAAAQRVLKSFVEPVPVPEGEVYLTCSIGISVYPQDGADLHRLLASADAACRHAKRRGGDGYQFYTEAMNTKAAERLELDQRLRRALSNGELDVHYQPQLDLVSGRVSGVEALLRWTNPQLGKVPPSRFIPLAEESGLIVQIGEWVLRQACLRSQDWLHRGLGPLNVSVNISPRQFQDHELAARVQGVLDETGLDPHRLILEITESALMDDLAAALTTLHSLSEMGVRLSIDDFGTGYSSLASLRQFPLNSLKIDRTFVSGVAASSEDCEIVSALIALAHNLGLGVVAEGVETSEQLAVLRARGCDEIQGFYLSRPIPADAVPEFLTAGFRAVCAATPRVVGSAEPLGGERRRLRSSTPSAQAAALERTGR